MIDVKDLNKSFGSNHVLKDINEHIYKGESGDRDPSGSGKEYLLRCLNLLEAPSSGEILLRARV